jgi:transposase
LDGLRGEDSIAELCRREGIAQSLYYKWSQDFMEAGKKRLAGDIVRQANSSEVTDLRREARDLKQVVAEQTLELRLLKKSMLGDGGEVVVTGRTLSLPHGSVSVIGPTEKLFREQVFWHEKAKGCTRNWLT